MLQCTYGCADDVPSKRPHVNGCGLGLVKLVMHLCISISPGISLRQPALLWPFESYFSLKFIHYLESHVRKAATYGDEATGIDSGCSRVGCIHNAPGMIGLLVAVPDGRIEEGVDEYCQVLEPKQAGIRPQQQQNVALQQCSTSSQSSGHRQALCCIRLMMRAGRFVGIRSLHRFHHSERHERNLSLP